MTDPKLPLLTGGERLTLDVETVTSGGGDKYHPRTAAEAAQLLAPMVQEVQSSLSELPEGARGSVVYFQATLLPNYLAASHFPAQLLSSARLVPVGSRSSPSTLETATKSSSATTKSLIIAGEMTSVDRLAAVIAGRGGGGTSAKNAFQQLREISEVRLSDQTEVLGSNDRGAGTWEAVLHPVGVAPSGDFLEADEATFAKWVSWIRELGGEVVEDYRREEAGLTFVPVRLDARRLPQASLFNPLRSLRPMPELRPIPTGLLRSAPPQVLPPDDSSPEGNHTVAIFDGGLHDDALLDEVASTELTSAAEDPNATSHGTAVTGAAIYGLLQPGSAAPRPASRAHHFRVVPESPPDQDLYAYWVLDQIEDVLQGTPFPIVNLSFGPDLCVEDAVEPNRWTSTLDRLAYEQDILFVVAAGNNGAEDPATGLNRVQAPADMANGLSVGACDDDLEGRWERTRYSAVGPGRDGSRVQPFGVQFGGDLASGSPFYGLQGGRRVWETEGTSFSTPLVTNSLSRLAALLDTKWQSASTLRAFAAHFVERHAEDDVRIATGHGRFHLDYANALFCDPHEVQLLYQGTIERLNLLSLAIPVPRSVVSGRVALRITLAFASPVEPTQPLEYTQATIEPIFRPHKDKFRFTNFETKRNLTVNVVTEPEKASKLYADGYQISGHPITKPLVPSNGNEIEL